MTEIVKAVGAGGVGGLVGWLTTLPAGVVVCLIVAVLIVQYALARETTRREAIRWQGAARVYRVGGDGAAVARGLRGSDAEQTPAPQVGPDAREKRSAPGAP